MLLGEVLEALPFRPMGRCHLRWLAIALGRRFRGKGGLSPRILLQTNRCLCSVRRWLSFALACWLGEGVVVEVRPLVESVVVDFLWELDLAGLSNLWAPPDIC